MGDDTQTLLPADAQPDRSALNHTIDQMLDWSSWLCRNGFDHRPSNGRSRALYRRRWPAQGRGWEIALTLYEHERVIAVYVYNNIGRYGKPMAFFKAAPVTIINLVQRLIAKIEQPLSDHTKKRHIARWAAEADGKLPSWVVETLDDPDDPTRMTREQYLSMFDRLRLPCFQKGQRVRVIKDGYQNGFLGTVDTASEYSCYVALDNYVEQGDPDPFRFMPDEVEAIRESVNDADDPGHYLAAVTYWTALIKAGFTATRSQYRKEYAGASQDQFHILIEPSHSQLAAYLWVDHFANDLRHRCLASLVVPAIDVLDVVARIEQLLNEHRDAGVAVFQRAMAKDTYLKPFGPILDNYEHLKHALKESEDDEHAKDLFQRVQQDHYFINVLRQNGLKLSRRPGENRPYYSLFYIPNSALAVDYDLYAEPNPDGSWLISAEGHKTFYSGEEDNTFTEHFPIDWSLEVPADADPEQIADEIKSALLRFHGPEEPPEPTPDVDDLDESAPDNPDADIDMGRFLKQAEPQHHVLNLLTKVDVRRIVQTTGYRVRYTYRDVIGRFFAVVVIPKEHYQPDTLDKITAAVRVGLLDRLPTMRGISQGAHIFDMNIVVAAYMKSSAYTDSSDLEAFVSIEPRDYIDRRDAYLKRNPPTKRKYRKRVTENEVPPVPDPDPGVEHLLKSTRIAQQGEIVKRTCPGCGNIVFLIKNWPDDAPADWGHSCSECNTWIPLPQYTAESAPDEPAQSLPAPKPPDMDADLPAPDYFKSTFDMPTFLRESGWKKWGEAAYTYYVKAYAMPHYQLGGMLFTNLQLKIGVPRTRSEQSSVGLFFVNESGNGLPCIFVNLEPQLLYPVEDNDVRTPPEHYNIDMAIRRFVIGAGSFVNNLAWKWPTGRHATMQAASTATQAFKEYVRELNQTANTPLYDEDHPPIVEARQPPNEDADNPEHYLRSIGTLPHVLRRHHYSKLYDDGTESGWMRTIPLQHPILPGTEPDTSDLTEPIREFRLVARITRKPDTVVTNKQVYELTMFVRLPRAANTAGAGRVIWRIDGTFMSEMGLINSLNRITQYTVQTLDDTGQPEPFRLSMIKLILRDGVSPFMRDSGAGAYDPIKEALAANEENVDDPALLVNTQPSFTYRGTSYLGTVVFVKTDVEEDWPRDIGRILLGPPPNPEVNPEKCWYVISVRGIPAEKLPDYGFGVRMNTIKGVPLRTFDKPNDAALAIWLTLARISELKQRNQANARPSAEDAS